MKEGNFMLRYYITQLQVILYVAPVMLLAIICHECAHGFVSDRLGDPTPRMSGRLTLNPLKHLDPIGTLCLLFFHMGWANPVPINPYYYKDRKKASFWSLWLVPLSICCWLLCPCLSKDCLCSTVLPAPPLYRQP